MKITDKNGKKTEHIGQVIGYTAREIHRALDARVAAKATPELSGARGMILSRIVCSNEEGKVVCQRDVETWFHIRRSSVTTMLQALEQDGFITRVSVAGDARLKRLIPTEKGVTYQRRIKKCIEDFEAGVQQDISAAELETLDDLLHRLLGNVHRMENELQNK